MAGLRGRALAEEALRIFRLREDRYRTGISVPELLDEFQVRGVRISSSNDASVLRDAMNKSQARGTWSLIGDGQWVPGSGIVKTGLTGRALAEALYAFARERYPGREFGYEEIRMGLERTGVRVQGLGDVTSKALASATDLFRKVPGRPGVWRWM